MGMGLLKFLVFMQLVIALAFFSGQLSLDRLEQTLADSERLVQTTGTKLLSSAAASTRR